MASCQHCSGRQSWTGSATGACTSSTAPWSAPISTPQERRGDPATKALSRSQSGYSTKIHLRCERGGKPMMLVLTAGELHEQPVLPLMMERGTVERAAPTTLDLAGSGGGDKSHSSPAVRRYPKERRIEAVIPTKSDEVPEMTRHSEPSSQSPVVQHSPASMSNGKSPWRARYVAAAHAETVIRLHPFALPARWHRVTLSSGGRLPLLF
jgi:hypothetical protein